MEERIPPHCPGCPVDPKLSADDEKSAELIAHGKTRVEIGDEIGLSAGDGQGPHEADRRAPRGACRARAADNRCWWRGLRALWRWLRVLWPPQGSPGELPAWG